MGENLDDAFAAFLTEIDTVEADAGGSGADEKREESSSTPPRKRSRLDEETNGAAGDSGNQRRDTLLKAAFHGNLAKVESVLSGLSSVDRLLLVDAADPEDTLTALHLAVIRGHIDVAKVLLRRRADIDVATSAGDTPLMWAAHRGSMEVCKELLRAGADASLKNGRGQSAAQQAQAAGHRRLHDYLVNHAFDASAGLKRKAASAMDAAAARRAANAALVEAALQKQREQEEEEAFWAGVRARREATAAGKPPPAAGSRPNRKDEEPAEAALLQAIPAHVRPHFITLGADADVTEADVRRLYRKLALKHHPDKHPDAPQEAKEMFTKIAIAYDAVCEYLSSTPQGGARIAPPSF